MSRYIGNELALFSHATNWKRYYGRSFRPYLKGGDVLEVGAGIGATTKILCDGSQNSWVCVEPDPELSEQINQKIRNGSLPSIVTVVTGTIDKLSTGKKFDCILYIDVIEHIEDDAAELDRASHALQPGGHLIVLVPAYNYLYSPFDKAIGHYRRYNKKMLRNAAPGDLKLERLFYLDSTGLVASLMNKWFLKQDHPALKQVLFWDKTMVPVSRFTDIILLRSIGKSLIGIWQKK